MRAFAARPNSRLKGGTPDSPARQEEDAPSLEAAPVTPRAPRRDRRVAGCSELLSDLLSVRNEPQPHPREPE